jgi:hypothetical protein
MEQIKMSPKYKIIKVKKRRIVRRMKNKRLKII